MTLRDEIVELAEKGGAEWSEVWLRRPGVGMSLVLAVELAEYDEQTGRGLVPAGNDSVSTIEGQPTPGWFVRPAVCQMPPRGPRVHVGGEA